MAIADMKRVDVLLPSRDQDAALKLLQRLGCLQFTSTPQAEGAAPPDMRHRFAQAEEGIVRIRWAIAKLSRFDKEKQSTFKPMPEVALSRLEDADLGPAWSVIGRIEAIEGKAGALRGEATRLALHRDQLAPWLGLDVPASQIRDTAHVRAFSGSARAGALKELMEAWRGRPAAVTLLGAVRDAAFFFAFVHHSLADEFLAGLKDAGFQHALPASGDLKPAEAAAQDDAAITETTRALAELDADLAALASDLPMLRVAHDALAATRARLLAEEGAARTASATLLSGWVPFHLLSALDERLRADFPAARIAAREPNAGEEPPVLLRNAPLVRPYEAVVGGFALPAPGAIDPTAVVMPFFACFFGMMVSDAGYGIAMALFVPLLIKIIKPSVGGRRLFWVIAGGGLSTILWGALFNTWFGFSPWPSLFDPVNNSLPVMMICIGLGALHLFAGLILGIVQNVRAGQWKDAIYDQVSWMMIVVGIGLAVLPQTSFMGLPMAVTGALIVLLFAGRNKTKNPIKRVLSGLGALYGITGWLSDLLSYMRLFGMGLATGVIGMVINQLVGMVMSGGIIGYIIGPVIFVGAHLFNAAINILGAYVHAARLQYIEFFGKFYQEGGKPFKPLSYAPRYYRVTGP